MPFRPYKNIPSAPVIATPTTTGFKPYKNQPTTNEVVVSSGSMVSDRTLTLFDTLIIVIMLVVIVYVFVNIVRRFSGKTRRTPVTMSTKGMKNTVAKNDDEGQKSHNTKPYALSKLILGLIVLAIPIFIIATIVMFIIKVIAWIWG